MNLLEECARHLSALGFGETADAENDGCVFYGRMPEKDGLQLTWVLEDGTGIENDVLFVDRDMTVTAVYAE